MESEAKRPLIAFSTLPLSIFPVIASVRERTTGRPAITSASISDSLSFHSVTRAEISLPAALRALAVLYTALRVASPTRLAARSAFAPKLSEDVLADGVVVLAVEGVVVVSDGGVDVSAVEVRVVLLQPV